MIALTESNLQYASYANLIAWLGSYFDGGNHAVGGNAPQSFPLAVYATGQGALPQPLTVGLPPGSPKPVGISIVFGTEPSQRRGTRWTMVEGVRQEVVYRRVRLTFYVRAETATAAGHQMALLAGQQLYALLANAAATRPLAQLGMIRWQPSWPQPVPDPNFSTMQLGALATLKYNVLVNGGANESAGDWPVQPSGTPLVRFATVNGVTQLVIYDAGQSAWVPLVCDHGALGVGAPVVPTD